MPCRAYRRPRAKALLISAFLSRNDLRLLWSTHYFFFKERTSSTLHAQAHERTRLCVSIRQLKPEISFRVSYDVKKRRIFLQPPHVRDITLVPSFSQITSLFQTLG